LQLAEVEVYASSGDVALSKTATQTSNAFPTLGMASLGVDGNNGGDWFGNSVTHTNDASSSSSWQVDLASDYSISKVVIYNRVECCSERLNPFVLSLKDSAGNYLRSAKFYSTQQQYTLTIPTHGVRTVQVQLAGTAARPLSLAEVEVFTLGKWTVLSPKGQYKTCSGCYKDMFAGSYNYCQGNLAQETKKGCSNGCPFTPQKTITLSDCLALCDAEPGCVFATSYYDSVCNLHFMSECIWMNSGGDGAVYKRT